jgi:hypothetical protein
MENFKEYFKQRNGDGVTPQSQDFWRSGGDTEEAL